MGYTFDGPNRRIILTSGTVSFSVDDMYSRWKDWLLTSDGSLYPEAFRSIGGDPLGASVFAGSYFFLQTQYGWRIRPQEASHVLLVNGNLFSEETGVDPFVSTLGTYNVRIQMQTSSLTQVASGSGFTVADLQAALDAQGYTEARALTLDLIKAILGLSAS